MDFAKVNDLALDSVAVMDFAKIHGSEVEMDFAMGSWKGCHLVLDSVVVRGFAKAHDLEIAKVEMESVMVLVMAVKDFALVIGLDFAKVHDLEVEMDSVKVIWLGYV